MPRDQGGITSPGGPITTSGTLWAGGEHATIEPVPMVAMLMARFYELVGYVRTSALLLGELHVR